MILLNNQTLQPFIFFPLVCSTRITFILKYTWKTAVIRKALEIPLDGEEQRVKVSYLEMPVWKTPTRHVKCLGVCTREHHVSHLRLSANKPLHKYLIYMHTLRFGHIKSGKGKSLWTITFASLGKPGCLRVFWGRAHLPLSSWVMDAVMTKADRKQRENRWTFKRGQGREEFPSDD